MTRSGGVEKMKIGGLVNARLEEGGFPPAKLLAVDDIEANLLVISAVLEPLGHEIVEANSGAAALRLASREEFAVILLDIMMPAMDGFEMLERLRQVPLAQHTPVILITAHDLDLKSIERAYALGAWRRGRAGDEQQRCE